MLSKVSVFWILFYSLIQSTLFAAMTSPDSQAKKTPHFPPFGTYVLALDTPLIEATVSSVKLLLRRPNLSDSEKIFIERMTKIILSRPIYRNGTARSRWNCYTKKALIQLLHASPYGQSLLKKFSENNLQLQAEIEAFIDFQDSFQ